MIYIILIYWYLILKAPCEAEAQCAELCKSNVVSVN